jgi:RNA polymerase sigma-70 factor (ECF subfamily)
LRLFSVAGHLATMKLSSDQFEKLALEHLDLLYRIARRLSHDSASAEDLVQETYLRALKARDNFDLQEFGIRPWLVRIMHNLHFSRSDRERRQPKGISEEQLDSAEAPVDVAAGAACNWDGMDERLVRSVAGLPPEYQSVLMLWAVDELSYKEISVALDVPIGTVMSRLYRARQRLAEQLSDLARQTGIIRE